MKARQLTRRVFLTSSASAAIACSSVAEGPGGTGAGGDGSGGAGPSAQSTSQGVGGGGGDGGQGGGQPFTSGFEPTDPWDPPGTLDLAAFAWGVQTGDVLPNSVIVSVRSLEPSVTMTVMRGINDGWEEVSSAQMFTPADNVAQLELTELAPDTTYAIAFYSADNSRRSQPARFRTALPDDEVRVVRFGATSCFGSSNGEWPCLTRSVDERLDFFLLLGDTIYADNNPNPFNFVEKFKTALSQAGLRNMTGGTSIIATWDDHEVDNNWKWSDGGIQAKYDGAIAAFKQGLPQREGGGTSGIWRKLTWGGAVEVFVLECRAERNGDDYISPEQMDWLKAELSASTSVWKIVANPVPIFDFSGTVIGPFAQGDRWQGHDAQRTEILSHIRDNNIAGVVWVSGDVHFGAATQVDQNGGPGDNAWDIIVGPAGANINPSAVLLNEGGRMPVLVRTHNYCLFEANAAVGTLLCRFIDNAGATVGEQMIVL